MKQEFFVRGIHCKDDTAFVRACVGGNGCDSDPFVQNPSKEVGDDGVGAVEAGKGSVGGKDRGRNNDGAL